jgi:DNA invertase Pin-like site-specific DNA recombinase
MGDLIGYARVSTLDQDPALQLDALSAAGCVKVFTDKASGALTSRPQFDAMLDFVRKGDTVCVWRLDRLGRNLKHLLSVVEDLERRGVGFRSLTESIETESPSGRLVLHIFMCLSEFERTLISERTRAGLQAAVARGRKGGRPTVMTASSLDIARMLRKSGKSYREIGSALKIGASTVREHLAKAG